MTVQPSGGFSLDDPLLSTDKVAEMFDVKPETIRDWIKQGKIAGVRINRNWKVRRSVAIAFGEARYGDPAEPIGAVLAREADEAEAVAEAEEAKFQATFPEGPYVHPNDAFGGGPV